MTGGLAAAADHRLPFYWWKGKDDSASSYAMKPLVAELFRDVRQSDGRRSAGAAAGADWTPAEERRQSMAT